MDYIVDRQNLVEKITNLTFNNDWEYLALEIFRFQYNHNVVYKKYIDALDVIPSDVKLVSEIPCLPIELFKSNNIQTGIWKPERIFLSSGTSQQIRSRHPIKEIWLYEFITTRCFESTFGPLKDFIIIAVLPSYQDNKDSSLLYMVNHFIEKTASPLSGYYSADKLSIENTLKEAKKGSLKPIVFGVSYALLDLAEQGVDLSEAIVMETGGMKGRRKEMLKTEMHDRLKRGLHVFNIYSEYGMAELLSQAYSLHNGIFVNSIYLKVRVKEINDPFAIEKIGKTGVIECIDLANIDSCSFIKTQDIGRMKDKDEFEIIGRLQDSDLRGCNLMYDQIEI